MASNERVINWYLVGVCSVYLIAFVSLFIQIPGLYGDRGILPAQLALKKDVKTLGDIVSTQPTLLHILPKLGINGVELGFNVICFSGIILSFLAFTNSWWRNSWTFATLWLFYQSLFQVGQTFLWFQWDTLLLEVGFLTIFIAPFKLPFINLTPLSKQSSTVSFWLVRWLTFRLMFCSGVVKLSSQCPTWWGLTAMTYHYESQCIPSPLAWYFHQLPVWFHKFSTASVFIIQIATSILFFSPFRAHRNLSFYLQSMLMVLIILTGNYNFFNWVSIVLCLSMVDDDFIGYWFRPKPGQDKPKAECSKTQQSLPKIFHTALRLSEIFVHFAVFGLIVYIGHHYFSISIHFNPFSVHSEINFSLEEYHNFLHQYVPITIWVGLLSLSVVILSAVLRSVYLEKGLVNKFFNVVFVVIISLFAIIMFCTSLVPYTDVDRPTQEKLPKQFVGWFRGTQEFHIMNSYGLFRSMTGVGGRPEVIVEGSNNPPQDDYGWKEYSFLYKPGNLERMLPVVAPHQPRLDWQMWFAALGSYQYNPWFYHMVYRLLNNQREVLQLIDSNPFELRPPKYIRAQLYLYHYTAWPVGNATEKRWWRREYVREYMPPVSLDDENLNNYVMQQELDRGTNEDIYGHAHTRCICIHFFNYLHSITPPRYGFYICAAFLLVGSVSLYYGKGGACCGSSQSQTSLSKKAKRS